MQIEVIHQSSYRYQPQVEMAQHMAYLCPRAWITQDLLAHRLRVTPEPACTRQCLDVYGNVRNYFALQAGHDVLDVLAQSTLQTRVRPAVGSSLPWERAQRHFLYRVGGHFDAAQEFVFASPCAPRLAEFAQYASASFSAGRSLLDAAVELMQRMHADFQYESHSTQVHTPALEAFGQRRGVCQDFAHILIACLRSLGLPARYVSGYLLTQAPPGMPKLLGSDASHAWASVYLPDPDLAESERWIDLDPTNRRWGVASPGEDYVTLALGRDFADVSPLRGVIYGGASHTLTIGVTVWQNES